MGTTLILTHCPRNLAGKREDLGKGRAHVGLLVKIIINRKGFSLLVCIPESKPMTVGWRSYKKVPIPVLFLDMTSHILRREHGSTPVDGSSKMTTLDPPMRAMDMDNFLFMPPDNVPTLLWRWLYSPVSFKVLQKESMVVTFDRALEYCKNLISTLNDKYSLKNHYMLSKVQ